jgi:hypothetical protein
MTKPDLRSRFSRHFDRPPLPGKEDLAIRESGGTTSAYDWLDNANKTLVSDQERIIELSEEKERLISETAYWTSIIELLLPAVPSMSSCGNSISAVAQKCYDGIDEGQKAATTYAHEAGTNLRARSNANKSSPSGRHVSFAVAPQKGRQTTSSRRHNQERYVQREPIATSRA